ncbi:MAG TPA: ATP-dependent helicase HrpB [Gemmatimonadales bacterium]|nr:ATP-dependent helicase HrpB [Gemmatimonadales bacterium]
MPSLPIEPVLPELAAALADSGHAVLQAPPGAGKTTRAPIYLLDRAWLEGKKILLLEPRRLAARAAARRMAHMLGERPGETVGYRVRRESAVGPRTRIEVVTEGILTRLIQSDPALEETGLVVFDEFHERSLHADLGLALTLQSRALVRPDLRILVMSATLDGGAVAALLGGAPIVTSEGRAFPVETRYRPRRAETRLEAAVASAVRESLATDEGDILVFLPGAAEIRRTHASLEADTDPEPGARSSELSVLPLHGSLTAEEQDAALAPSPPGRRKVVLATSIAETSLTIEGVRVVIDAGLARVPRFSPRTGMTRLTTVRVSRASADQRRGRAGRTAPGVCYRLWAQEEDHHLLPHGAPEIAEADLAPLALELAAAGIGDPGALAWLTPPPAAAVAEGRGLLRQLDALDRDGRITARGRELVALGTHPRLGRLLLAGREAGAATLAGQLVALLEERDVLRAPDGTGDPDLQLRVDLVAGSGSPPVWHGMEVDRGRLHRVRQEARLWARQLHAVEPRGQPRSAAELLALAYPDRVGQRRPGQAGRFLLRNGMGAFTTAPALMLADYIVAAELDGDRRESRIWLAASLDLGELTMLFGGQVEDESVVEWVETEGVLKAVRRRRLGAIVLEETPLRDPDPALVRARVEELVRREGLAALTWSDEATRLRERLAFARRLADAGGITGDWPDVSDRGLLDDLDRWLGPSLGTVRRRADLAKIDPAGALAQLLGWEERRALDQLAPTHLEVPTGSRIPVSYADPEAPVLAVRLQEVFGLTETPRVGGGRVPVTMHLLSPAHRPVQVTRDLAGFWRTSYFDVRKDLRGRYPKHEWPEDPLTATPTRRAKPRK